MSIGAGEAALPDFAEQAPPVSRSLGPATRQEGFVVGGCTRFQRHGIAFGKDNQAHLTLNTPPTNTQFASDRRHRLTGDVEGPDRIE